MGTFFVDLAVSAKHVAYSILSDSIGLSTRPLALLSFCFPEARSKIEFLIDGELLPGLVATVSIALLVISCVQVLNCEAAEVLVRFAAAIYTADGMAQFPQIAAPQGSWVEGWLPTGSMDMMSDYPMSRTGIFVTVFQLRWCPIFALRSKEACCAEHIEIRLWLVIFALPLRYMSIKVLTSGGPASCFMYIISIVLFTLAITPSFLREAVMTCCEKMCEYAKYICSLAYNFVVYIWPRIKACVWAVLVNRFTRWLYDLCQPCWNRFHTCCMPLAMSAVAYSCATDVQHIVSSQTLSTDHAVYVLGKSFCGASAAVSTIILGWHGASRVCRRRESVQPDPLNCVPFLWLLKAFSFVISAPWRAVRAIAEKLFEYILFPIIWPVAECALNLFLKLFCFAFDCPILSIPLVLLVNVILIMNFAKARGFVVQYFGFVRTAATSALGLQGAGDIGTVTDSGLAILLIAAVQIGTFCLVDGILSSVRVVRNPRTGDALSLEDLNEIAAGMNDPRQCARCGFGPVDYAGCADLQAHHMEVGVRGGRQSRVSNACPRCDWFTTSIASWPGWDGDLHTEAGRAMFRQRVWCEVVVGVRAVAKALLFPYGILRLGQVLAVPPSLPAFLALTYIVPWVRQNAEVVALLVNGSHYNMTRRSQPRPPPQAAQAGGTGDHGADCEAAVSAPLVPPIEESEALANILSNTPTQAWIQEGDVCSVCLERFPPEAAAAARSGRPIGDICQELHRLDPPVVLTRCGHALHVQCAEDAVKAGGANHVRCPLCRQPVTLQGEAAAVMFS